MVDKLPKFASQLYLFDNTDNKLKPVRKIELSDLQKAMLVKQGWIMMRTKTRIFILNTEADSLLDNRPKLNVYKPVVDTTNGEIIILGIYKVNEDELEEPKPETIH